MSNIILDKFSKGVDWIAKETKSAYDEQIKNDQFKSDMIGCCVILIDLGKKDIEIYDIINRYFGVDNLSEIKKYVSEAHEWIEDNK
mgnify:CR=1 FL=1